MSAPLPTGTAATAGMGRSPAATASVTSSARVAAPVEIRGVVAVDQQVARVLRGVGLRGAAGGVEVLAALDTVAPSARIRATLARFARVEQNTTAGTPSARAA